ncbi:MAG TPA: hypothetical protein VGM60_20750 [Pseudonocardia sp.]|jgi:hypothetical protein|uniref:hypothetical protein n=1 Tax=Pseudonocardia sp. TaxID=60912 RepID=UPI002F4203B1
MDAVGCRYRTVSAHPTSLGWVRYQACLCGQFRVVLGRHDASGAEPAAVLARVAAPVSAREEN